MTYGLVIRNPSNQEILNVSSRKPRFSVNGTTGSITAASYVDVYVTGMANDDSWIIFIENADPTYAIMIRYTVTKFSGYFRISNGNSGGGLSFAVNYWVMRT